MSLLQLPRVIESVNELGQRVAKLELMIKELQDAFVMATQQNVENQIKETFKKTKAK